MKGLKKLTLATAIAAAPFAANAELKALDDTSMGNVTGQAGVTIELSAKVDIGEVAYQDEGFLAISDVSIGAGDWATDATTGEYTGGVMDQSGISDIKLYIDVVGAGLAGDTGAGGIGSEYLGAAAADPANGVAWSDTKLTAGDYANYLATADIENGDLVIGLRSVSGLPVSYGLGIGKVSLAQSGEADDLGKLNEVAGDTSTTLISDLRIKGELGPIDVVIQENSNEMNISAFFNAEGGLKADFVGTYLDFELHNRRGDDTNRLQIAAAGVDTSFAYAQVDIGLGTNAAGEEALAFDVNNFSGDLDLKNIRMGASDAASIGDLYMTDMNISASMIVYGH
ncbi:hypothetical protein LPB19_11030 [Marinobacter salinisoli]|uniref:DUF6160 domain-containing protein n=1 Tax=Marinobacter salinisoli TaxID=2769486 RepID=A0ABX7MNA1_9GAMM|nr:DUF6160 family protein [Marinobacter salinisoli]QSP93732.1 hypothetical protein LPB19_11030 [Marinobacter salinisoli]